METLERELKYREKILAIRKAAHVDKTMNVTMGAKGSYKAHGEKDVLDALQPLLDKHKIDVYPCNLEVISSSATHFKGIYTFRFIDCETGYSEEVVYAGSGSDKSDKDTGKAGTYAFKNMLIKRFFLVSGEDTDNQSSDSQANEVFDEICAMYNKLYSGGFFHRPQVNPKQEDSKAQELCNSKKAAAHSMPMEALYAERAELIPLLERIG